MGRAVPGRGHLPLCDVRAARCKNSGNTAERGSAAPHARDILPPPPVLRVGGRPIIPSGFQSAARRLRAWCGARCKDSERTAGPLFPDVGRGIAGRPPSRRHRAIRRKQRRLRTGAAISEAIFENTGQYRCNRSRTRVALRHRHSEPPGAPGKHAAFRASPDRLRRSSAASAGFADNTAGIQRNAARPNRPAGAADRPCGRTLRQPAAPQPRRLAKPAKLA